MPQLVYETVWDTTKFNNLWTSGPNPFVWSFEGTGSGTHADVCPLGQKASKKKDSDLLQYMFGWKGDALQKAMDKSECRYDGCGAITQQSMSVANQCKVKDYVRENIDGCTF
jgi:hypothetical protein